MTRPYTRPYSVGLFACDECGVVFRVPLYTMYCVNCRKLTGLEMAIAKIKEVEIIDLGGVHKPFCIRDNPGLARAKKMIGM